MNYLNKHFQYNFGKTIFIVCLFFLGCKKDSFLDDKPSIKILNLITSKSSFTVDNYYPHSDFGYKQSILIDNNIYFISYNAENSMASFLKLNTQSKTISTILDSLTYKSGWKYFSIFHQPGSSRFILCKFDYYDDIDYEIYLFESDQLLFYTDQYKRLVNARFNELTQMIDITYFTAGFQVKNISLNYLNGSVQSISQYPFPLSSINGFQLPVEYLDADLYAVVVDWDFNYLLKFNDQKIIQWDLALSFWNYPSAICRKDSELFMSVKHTMPGNKRTRLFRLNDLTGDILDSVDLVENTIVQDMIINGDHIFFYGGITDSDQSNPRLIVGEIPLDFSSPPELFYIGNGTERYYPIDMIYDGVSKSWLHTVKYFLQNNHSEYVDISIEIK